MGDEINSAGAASPESPPAAAGSEPLTGAGAVPVTQPAAAEGTAVAEGEITGQEAADAGKEGHQKTFEERMAEIKADLQTESDAKLAAMEKKFLERQEAEVKPFTELSSVQLAELNTNYVNADARIAEIQDLQAKGDRNPMLVTEKRQLQKWLSDTEVWFSENERKKEEWEAKNSEKTKASEAFTALNNSLGTAASMHIEQMIKDGKVTQEVAAVGQKWFGDQLQSNRPLAEEYMERAQKDGSIRATKWAIDYTLANMSKKETALIAQKEAAKDALVPGKTMSGVVVGNPELDALRAQAAKTGNPEDLARYTMAKRKATTQ